MKKSLLIKKVNLKRLVIRPFSILNGGAVRDTIIREGMRNSESVGFFFGNLTSGVIDTSRGAVAIHGSRRLATNGMKATHDFAKGDAICATCCTIASFCELSTIILVWVPIPGKIPTLTALKCVSVTAERVRDMCSQGYNPFC